MTNTSAKYCAECLKDFSHNQKVYYTWYENRCFCKDCKMIMNTRVSSEYLDWETKVVIKS